MTPRFAEWPQVAYPLTTGAGARGVIFRGPYGSLARRDAPTPELVWECTHRHRLTRAALACARAQLRRRMAARRDGAQKPQNVDKCY